MITSEMLYNFINELNNSLIVGESEYTEDFNSEEFRAVDREINDGFETKITVLEDEFIDYDDKPLYSYSFGLDGISLDEIEGYDFDAGLVSKAIKNYAEKIRSFAESQKRETELRLDGLNTFLGRIDKNRYWWDGTER